MKNEQKLTTLILMLAAAVGGPAAAHATPQADAARADIQKTFGFVPGFIKFVPELSLAGAWMDMKGLQMNPSTALPGKMKELLGLAVSAQIPCEYCVFAHTEFAKLNGASDAEIAEAVAMGAMTRRWSTFMNGIQTDESKFRSEIAQLLANMKKAGTSGMAPAKPITVVDGKTALDDIKQSFGFVPEFLRRYPQEGLGGVWTEMRDVEMNPSSAIPGKYKSVIGLAVASQIPCKFCIIADTEFAKTEGASERELTEAVAMAGVVRYWSTILNGRQVDKATFKKDITRLVAGAKKHMAAQTSPGAQRSPGAPLSTGMTAAK